MVRTYIQARKRLLRLQIHRHLSGGVYTTNSAPFKTMVRALGKLSEAELDALAVLLETATTAATDD